MSKHKGKRTTDETHEAQCACDSDSCDCATAGINVSINTLIFDEIDGLLASMARDIEEAAVDGFTFTGAAVSAAQIVTVERIAFIIREMRAKGEAFVEQYP